jgi:hypothetical protein
VIFTCCKKHSDLRTIGIGEVYLAEIREGATDDLTDNFTGNLIHLDHLDAETRKALEE